MKNRYAYKGIIFYSAIIFIAISIVTSTGFNVSTLVNKEGTIEEGPGITKLEWTSPNGELPGTYEEYLEDHSQSPAIFSKDSVIRGVSKLSGDLVSILVDSDLYPNIVTSLNQYMDDLVLEGNSVFLQTVSGGTPQDIKDWVIQRYNLQSYCFVFVGDITAAWAEVSGSEFPCDLFYMDLDGYWEDSDSDGDYDIHTAGSGDMGPEVFVGRIYATSLDYDSEVDMVNDYFAKVHSYRVGSLSQPWRGLEYVDEDWYDMEVHLDNIYGSNVVRYDYGYYTTGADYLDQMDLGQHFVQVCAHSYSGGHHFSTNPTESAVYAHVYVYSPTSRSARLLLGCDDGIKVWLNGVNVYTNDRYDPWYEDNFNVNVNLNAGWNQLLCKVSQAGYDYLLSARFTDLSYNTFNDLVYQINDPNIHSAEAEFIRSWLLNGFHEDTSGNFWYYLTTNYLGVSEGSINPTGGEVMGGKTWTVYNSGCPYIDLSDYDEQDFGATYAFARVYADTSKSCELWLGYDDGARVWLNGAEVLYDNRYGGFTADMTKFAVNLNPGENRLLVKVSEWMSTHGFSARFCQPDGSPVEGLSYDPVSTPIEHMGKWLLDGPYTNPDEPTRLSTDYLGGEAAVTPSEGDTAPIGTWARGIGNGRPFNIGSFYDNGDWVYSETIQERDPPVLFYNLFSCGPGRFTDENYLAGAYIFHTTYGLITIASAKSGSMLYFDDFTRPLGDNKCIGRAYFEWFDTQAPFDLWEQEWYYGMVLCGDPTLHLIQNVVLCGDANGDGIINVSDVVYLINYHFIPDWPAPDPLCSGDVNGDSQVDISDVVYLINYLFVPNNPPPVDNCC